MESRKTNIPTHLLLWQKTDKKKSDRSVYLWEKERASKPIKDNAETAARNAKMAAELTKPCFTGLGLLFMTSTLPYLPISIFGVPMTIGGIMVDLVKAPVCLTVATEEAARAGVTKLASLLFEGDPIKAESERIFKSFLTRMKETAAILVALDLEKPDVLNQKLKSGDIEDLVALTLLHTAYASRDYEYGLLLASKKTLTRENCPEQGLPLFDKVIELKNLVKQALKGVTGNKYFRTDEDRQIEESKIVCQWIKDIAQGKALTASDRPNVSQAELNVINDIIKKIDILKVYAMEVMPESPENVGEHVSNLRMKP